MKITAVGHAGFLFETRGLRILCDPWFNPAYFGSWYPFPAQDTLDQRLIAEPTHLFVSHLHRDHFDPEYLAGYISKRATVILPDFPLDELERALRALGFRHFLRTRNGEPVEVDGVQITVLAMTTPTDGPLGDSGLVIDDGAVRIFNLNDSRPPAAEPLAGRPLDALFLQYSGAIWYPLVYDFHPPLKASLGRKKRANQIARAQGYVRALQPRYTVPAAGPPCFLDDDLFWLNDLGDDSNIFPTAEVFLAALAESGLSEGRLLIPGSVGELTPSGFRVRHPLPEEQVRAIFGDKEAYLRAYQERERPRLAAIRAAWPRGRYDVAAELKVWFEPLLEQADHICAGVDGRVLFEFSDAPGGVLLDFRARRVTSWQGEDDWLYRFQLERALIEDAIDRRCEDWVNDLFLSCRFTATRRAQFNEYLFTFFKCLSPERLQYAEGYFAEQEEHEEDWETHGYRLQRRCPHRKADLTRFGEVDEATGILTCHMHGWQFDLNTGRCLTSGSCKLKVERVESARPGATRPA